MKTELIFPLSQSTEFFTYAVARLKFFFLINSQSVVHINVIIIIGTGCHAISPEDLQTICKLYQKCPKLWVDFRNVISFLDLLTESPQAYKQLCQHLVRIVLYTEGVPDLDNPEEDLLLFAVAAGFVERSVQFSRQIMREMGKTYITEFPPFARVNTGFDMQCLRTLRGMLLNATIHSSQFCLHLAQTGFLEDLMEDVKHLKHLSGEALVSTVWLCIDALVKLTGNINTKFKIKKYPKLLTSFIQTLWIKK